MATVIFEDQLEVPQVLSLDEFRAWAHSPGFPERGRIDYLSGRIEVDMSPEDLFAHGTVKSEIARELASIVKDESLGHLFTDCTRVSSPAAKLSVEPDIVFVSQASISGGRVRLVPKASGAEDRYIELEGGPDLIVEIVSDSSVQKDTQRLPAAYFQAGVTEYWLVDARTELSFELYRRGSQAFEAVPPDAEGFRHSALFGRAFRLDRHRDSLNLWAYDLRSR